MTRERVLSDILWIVAENPVEVLNKEIYNPAALNQLEKSITGLYRHQKGATLQFTHIWPIKGEVNNTC